jgi:cyclophilin family peptidyl-prolyl cis-trans isomerase
MLDINLNEFTDLRFDAGGVLAMANNGPATTAASFYYTRRYSMARR